MAELSPLAQNIWRRYGDGAGLIRTAPFLRAFERAERMSRLPLLNLARRWVPAEADPFQAGRGFADFALPRRPAFQSERQSGAESSVTAIFGEAQAAIVSEARQDATPHAPTPEELPLSGVSAASRHEGAPGQWNALLEIPRTALIADVPGYQETPAARNDPPLTQHDLPVLPSLPLHPSPAEPHVQSEGGGNPPRTPAPIVRAAVNDARGRDPLRPASHPPGLIGRPLRLEPGASLEMLYARGRVGEPTSQPATANVPAEEARAPLRVVRLDDVGAKPQEPPQVWRVQGDPHGPAGLLHFEAPQPPKVTVSPDVDPPFDSPYPIAPQTMPLAPAAPRQDQSRSDEPPSSIPVDIASVPIRPDVPAESAPVSPEVDLARVADQVYSLLVERLTSERDRRGY